MIRNKNLKSSFWFVSLNETLDEVNKLNLKEVSQATGVLVRIIKENKDLVSFYVFHNFNNALSSCSFPTALKYADLWPASKKDDKENYRPISILPNFLIESFQNFSVVFVKVLT